MITVINRARWEGGGHQGVMKKIRLSAKFKFSFIVTHYTFNHDFIGPIYLAELHVHMYPHIV